MEEVQSILEQTIFPVLSPHLVQLIKKAPSIRLSDITEIRLRINQPIVLVLGNRDCMINISSVKDILTWYICTQQDLDRTLQIITRNSVYAMEQEFKSGFITIDGGHRIGLGGETVVVDGKIKSLKNISSLNIRICREVRGCSDDIIPHIIIPPRQVLSTLILSPPRAGKTTILRDIIRQLSTGIKKNGFIGVQVGLVDERSEIAACENGIPTVDIGRRVDILDACPKAEGLLLLIRAMSPNVVITDEIGRKEDVTAILEALNAGVSVITTVHAGSIAEVSARPYVNALIKNRYFDRYVILGSSPHPGVVEKIIDAKNDNVLYSPTKGVRVCG